MADITINDLTTAELDGQGIFDVLMRSAKAHLDVEFAKNRIHGPQYAEVYLGSLTQVLQSAMQFVLAKQTSGLQAELLQQQILLAQKQVDIAAVELQIKQQQRENLVAENENIPKQGALIDANKDRVVQEIENLAAQKLQIQADTALTDQKKANAVIEATVLIAQECKLRAEFDVTMLVKDKTISETNLLNQKQVTEVAQVSATGVDADSVVGRQKALYVAQTDGFKRDAEQKATKLLIDTWSVRRSTDDGTLASTVNKLDDVSIGRSVTKLLEGIGA